MKHIMLRGARKAVRARLYRYMVTYHETRCGRKRAPFVSALVRCCRWRVTVGSLDYHRYLFLLLLFLSFLSLLLLLLLGWRADHLSQTFLSDGQERTVTFFLYYAYIVHRKERELRG